MDIMDDSHLNEGTIIHLRSVPDIGSNTMTIVSQHNIIARHNTRKM